MSASLSSTDADSTDDDPDHDHDHDGDHDHGHSHGGHSHTHSHGAKTPSETEAPAAVTVSGAAARPLPGHRVGDGEIHVPDAVLQQLGVEPGDLLKVRSAVGYKVFTRAISSGDAVDGTLPMLRVGRMLWTQLLVKPGDRLEVERASAPAVARTIAVRPPFKLSHNLNHRLEDSLVDAATVVWPGAMLFVPILPGGGGVVVRVEGVDDEAPAYVTKTTEVTFEEADPDIARRKVTFAEVGGLDGAIRRLRDLIELPLLRPGLYRSLGVRPPKGVLLHGPPGTGKTLLSRAVAQELGANIMKLPATELIGAYSGETESNLRALFNEASHHAPTLIIIDEIDVISTRRSSLASQGDIRATTQLLTLMDGLEEVDGVVLLATTNRIDSVDEAFRRPGRFDEEIYIGPPEGAARRDILSIHTREMPLTVAAEAALTDIADRRTAGFTGADLMHLTREAGLAAARRITGSGAGFEIADQVVGRPMAVEVDDLYGALDRLAPSAMRGLPVVEPELEWDAIEGVDEVKDLLLEVAGVALGEGTGRREGVLLSGPSGNGKSVLVQALAARIGANFVLVDGSTIFTQWLGESEAALRSLFRKAHDVVPAIVVLEHLDAIAPRRVPGHTESASSRVLSALLSSVDDALQRGGILVVGVTDRADMIDSALTRAGRLGVHLQVGPPDAERRRRILTRSLGDAVTPDELTRLVEENDGRSAADVERQAVRELRRTKGK